MRLNPKEMEKLKALFDRYEAAGDANPIVSEIQELLFKENPKKTEKILLRMDAETLKKIDRNAFLHTDGNSSEWCRKAAIHYDPNLEDALYSCLDEMTTLAKAYVGTLAPGEMNQFFSRLNRADTFLIHLKKRREMGREP